MGRDHIAVGMAREGPDRRGRAGPAELLAPAALLRRWPHLAAMWACAPWSPGRLAPPGAALLLPRGEAPPAAWDGRILHLDPGPFAPPEFAGHVVPPILFAAEAADPVAALLARGGGDPACAAALRPLLREARLGGPPGLPDPGPSALGVGPGEAVVVLDPCDPAGAAATRAAWGVAVAGAAGRPVIALRDPTAPVDAAPVLPQTRAARLAPWTILDAACRLHARPGPTALLAGLAGIALRLPDGGAPDGLAWLAALADAARCADPATGRAIAIEEAIRLLGAWRRQEAANRGIAVCLGMSFWKRRAMAAALASSRGAPAFARGAGSAVAEALTRRGAIAVWASRAPRGLEARARAAGVPVVWVEDGFIRSAGLGAGFLPAASITLDARRPYYDPEGPSDLEVLLATAAFPPALLARAAALRAALVARRVTKYNLPGTVPALPATSGRRRILVPGQVEDDLSVLRGGAGAVRGNLDLLRAVRAAEPKAFIIFKPHPDVEAGYRRGGVAAAEAAGLADLVLARAPIAPLLGQVDAVHTLTSLAGFEALLRGLPVTCWGRPFYAGWGLTQDRAPIPRRARRLSLDELVAGALILHPRYQDPVTLLPTTPEALLDRLAEAAPWRGGVVAWLRRWQGAVMARATRQRGG